MTREDIYKKLNSVFRDVFDDDTISVCEKTTANDIEGWDSLMHISLISAIEDEFDFRFKMKDVVGMHDVGEMVDIIDREIS